MKKIIVGIFGLAMLLVSQNASATAVWNGVSNDCISMAVANHTNNDQGIEYPCWKLTTISAVANDSVNIRIYYHNTSGQPATNVKIKLTAPTAASNYHSFSGQITSDQGNLTLNNVSVTTPPDSKLIFGGTHWLPDQRQTESGLLYNQTGAEILTTGLSIGTIASSWSAQGSVVIAFSTKKPDTTGTIDAASSTCQIQAGQSNCQIPFTWRTYNPVSTSTVVKNGTSGAYKTGNDGSNINFDIPYGSSTFDLIHNNVRLDSETVSASCAAGSNWDSSSMSCKLPVQDCRITDFSANKTEVGEGDPVLLSWSTENCNSVSITPGVGSNLNPNTSKTIYPTSTTTYTITGYGSTNATPTQSVLIKVGGPVGAPGFPAGAPGYPL